MRHNSREFKKEQDLHAFTTRDAYECRVPKSRFPRDAHITVSVEKPILVNPMSATSMSATSA